MTQTLTTEAMQEIYESAVHSEASGSQEAEFELLCKLEDIGGTSATIRKLIDIARAANRETQPAGFYTTVSGRKGVVWHNGAPEDDTAIFTAPPAPAVPDDYQHLKNVQELHHKQEDRLFSLAQRIKGPSFDKYSQSVDQAIGVLEHEIFGDDGDACRAAMLAQPVSQGCKLVPVPTVKKFIPVSSVSSTVNGTEPFPAALTCEEAAALDGTIFLSHLKPGGMVQVYAAVGKDDDRELIAFNPKDFKFTAPDGGNG